MELKINCTWNSQGDTGSTSGWPISRWLSDCTVSTRSPPQPMKALARWLSVGGSPLDRRPPSSLVSSLLRNAVSNGQPDPTFSYTAMNVGCMYLLSDICPGSYGSSTFNFLKNLHVAFHSGYTTLHSYPRAGGFLPFDPDSLYVAFVICRPFHGGRSDWHQRDISWQPLFSFLYLGKKTVYC